MLDYRVNTFLKLCETMHYHRTAELLHMTQPAVSQHIKYLEKVYGCKLFIYDRKTLVMTEEAKRLEAYARSAAYNDAQLRRALKQEKTLQLRIGATKTIGEFVIQDRITALTFRRDMTLELIIDNTENLLALLEKGKIDFALIEGHFDKSKYAYKLFRRERFSGLCGYQHRFAGKSISFEALFDEALVVRESGSGTRAIFEQYLHEYGFDLEHFSRRISISSFKLIKDIISEGEAVTFAYEAIAKEDDRIAFFDIEGAKIYRDFNYVHLKNTDADKLIDVFSADASTF